MSLVCGNLNNSEFTLRGWERGSWGMHTSNLLLHWECDSLTWKHIEIENWRSERDRDGKKKSKTKQNKKKAGLRWTSNFFFNLSSGKQRGRKSGCGGGWGSLRQRDGYKGSSAHWNWNNKTFQTSKVKDIQRGRLKGRGKRRRGADGERSFWCFANIVLVWCQRRALKLKSNEGGRARERSQSPEGDKSFSGVELRPLRIFCQGTREGRFRGREVRRGGMCELGDFIQAFIYSLSSLLQTSYSWPQFELCSVLSVTVVLISSPLSIFSSSIFPPVLRLRPSRHYSIKCSILYIFYIII